MVSKYITFGPWSDIVKLRLLLQPIRLQKRLGFRPLTNEKKITCLYLKEVKRITSQIPGPYLYFPLWRRCLNVASMINLSFMCQANFIIFNLDSFLFWGKSTTSQLLQDSNEIGKPLDQIIQTDILILISPKLLTRLIRVSGNLLNWFQNYLTDRHHAESHHLRQDIAISPPPPPRAIRCSPGFDPWFSAVSYVRERPTSTYHDIVCSTVS